MEGNHSAKKMLYINEMKNEAYPYIILKKYIYYIKMKKKPKP